RSADRGSGCRRHAHHAGRLPEGLHPHGHLRRGGERAAAPLLRQLIAASFPALHASRRGCPSRRARAPYPALAALLILGPWGCDVERPASDDPTRGAVPPPVSVLRVEATTSYDVDGRPQYEAIPEGGVLTGVTRTASVRVHFDRFLDPVRVIRQSLCIRPILDDVFGIDDCVEPLQEFTEPNYSPAR